MSEDRDIVGDLTASVGYNEPRRDGSETTQGIESMLSQLEERDEEREEEDDDSQPFPSMVAAGASAQGLGRLRCPVGGCTYTHISSQGLAGHIPNSPKDGHSWDSVDVTPADLHELASTGTHPEPNVRELLNEGRHSRKHTHAADVCRNVRSYFFKDVPLSGTKIRVFVNPRYGSVNVELRERVPQEHFDAYRNAIESHEDVWFSQQDYLYVIPAEVAKSLPTADGLTESVTGR